MLIQLSDDVIYNESSGDFIRKKVAPPQGDRDMYVEFTSSGKITYSDDKDGKKWDTLCEVAELQMDALRLRGFDGE